MGQKMLPSLHKKGWPRRNHPFIDVHWENQDQRKRNR